MSTHRYAFPRLRADGRLRTGARKVLQNHPFGTGFGSTVGAALITAAAGAAGAGPVGVVTSIATGIMVGGWAGHTISRRRSKQVDGEVARRRTRVLRLLKVTRMLRRRNVA
jgi:hypothetical protein